ncbi:ATP-binding protein [Pedobacter aquatilis]|uniref:ATP-binding protein n=1 Tax=Pedobacter aquatilis TaxID=351343 RepID=UPI0025B34848|nr:ATP-binding protein [Pedobacter aquatilis]MDN3586084.1 ATP-binding protein [Pedobacter aquatilis]
MSIFDSTIELPQAAIQQKAKSLIGFQARFNRIHTNLKLLLDQQGIREWSQKFHKAEIPAIANLEDKYPLVILAGDAGTGKTASAMAIADEMLRELKKEGYFLKLSTRVRGEGLHGEMGKLVNDAFAELKNLAGKNRIAFLLIDEADAIATTRSTAQMHQEEKSAVNTLIQKIDDIRELKGRAIILMSTNRLHFIDEAIVRRAAVVLHFDRPDEKERRLLFEQDLEGLKLKASELDTLSQLSGPEANNGLGFSFSDLRLKVIPEAIARCYPEKALNFEDLAETIQLIQPSPKII